MCIKESLRKIKNENAFTTFLYNEIYLRYIKKIKQNILIKDYGKGNIVKIPKNTCCENLRIIFKGNHNIVKVGEGCKLLKTNEFFIQNDGNELIIGDNVVFDQDVSIVLGEGTKCGIGSECIFAKGVRIRTCDQHFIYNQEGKRINHSKNVCIEKHVWLGASVIVMKGTHIQTGSVIGIDSMVTKDIPANCIAVGKPAKVIKQNISWKEY